MKYKILLLFTAFISLFAVRQALADGGTVAGMTLDDIDRMTSRELRATLRETRENAEAQARLFDADGAPVGDSFQVHTTALGSQERPDVATLANGDFVIVWTVDMETVAGHGFFS